MREILGGFVCGLLGLAGLGSVAFADVTPPALDVMPCPHCRGAAVDIDACDRALEEDDNDKAVELCSRALRSEHLSDYDRAIGHIARGVAYDNRGQHDRAIRDYDEAIRLNPREPLHLSNRGRTNRLKGDYGAAIRDYNRAIELSPQDADIYLGRGLAYHYSKEYERAI